MDQQHSPFRHIPFGRLAAVAVVLVVAAGMRVAQCTDDYYTSDAADYVRASQVGLRSLYTATSSASAWSIREKWKDAAFRAHPADQLYRAKDNAALRHFHGPGSMYVLAAAHDLGWNERQQRILWALIGAATCALMTWVLCQAGVWVPLAAGAGLLAAADPRIVLTDVDPCAPHTLYLFLTLFACALAVAWAGTTRRAAILYAGAATLALATITFELAPALLLSLAAGLIWETRNRGTLRERFGPALRFLGAYIGFLFVFWPGGFTRGALAISYGGILASFRRQSYGHRSLLEILQFVFGGHELYFAIALLFAIALYWVFLGPAGKRRPPNFLHVVFGCNAIFAVLFAFSARFKNLPYFAEAFIPALLIAALTIDAASARAGRWISTAAASLFLLAAVTDIARATVEKHQGDAIRQVVGDIEKTTRPGNGVILVNDTNAANALFLYLPSYEFEMTKSPSDLALRHPEMETRVRMALINTYYLDPPARERASQLFPAQFVYREHGSTLWLGSRKAVTK